MSELIQEFRTRLCRAAVKSAEAGMFEDGPVLGRSLDEFRANIATKDRVDDAALAAMIEVVLFAKVHGEEIIALRHTSPPPPAGADDGIA